MPAASHYYVETYEHGAPPSGVLAAPGRAAGRAGKGRRCAKAVAPKNSTEMRNKAPSWPEFNALNA